MGLLKTAAKVAVASSVHGRVQRRQQSRWAARDQAAAQAATPVTHAPQPAAPQAPAVGVLAELSALVVSCGVSSIVLAVFRAKGTFLGSTSASVSPAVYLVVGGVALAAAVFAATKRGRELIGREVDRRHSDDDQPDPHGSISDRARAKVDDVKSKAEEAMKRGSVWVAIAAGVVLGAPLPFSLAAVGIMVRNGYGLPVQLILILAFSLVTYLVVEVPILSYVLSPDATASRVAAFSTWLGRTRSRPSRPSRPSLASC